MRAAIPTLAVLALMLSAPLASAAPTCLDRSGGMARCGASGAMPVGWTPTAAAQVGRPTGEVDPSDYGGLLGLTLFLAGLFGVIALLPDFEGRWDRQAGDDDRRD